VSETVEPADPGEAKFRGGLHVRRFIGGVGAPIGGHLEVTRDHLRFSGLGFDVKVRRDDVQAVRFGPGFNATRVSAILHTPSQEQMFWLSTKHPGPIRMALAERGWPIVEDDSLDLGVAEEFPD